MTSTEERVCSLDGCEVRFVPAVHNQKFCTQNHQAKSHTLSRRVAKFETRICGWCENEYTPHREDQKYCSMPCSSSATNASRRGGQTQKTQEPKLADSIAQAERAGYVVHKPRPIGSPVLDVDALTGKDRIKLAVVCCTHFGSKYQQLTALREFCQYAAEVEKVDGFVHAGDVEDGPNARHRNPSEVFKHEFDGYLDYTVDVLPRHDVPWHIISGNHDDWWTDDGGPDLVKALCDRRDDCTYLGKSLGYISFKDTLIEVIHPDVGSAYAYSWRAQKHVESLSAERKPAVSLIGNFHKACIVPRYRNVLAIQLAAFQSQTHWMATKSIVSEVGGLILEIGLHTKGIAPSVKFETVYFDEPRENDWP